MRWGEYLFSFNYIAFNIILKLGKECGRLFIRTLRKISEPTIIQWKPNLFTNSDTRFNRILPYRANHNDRLSLCSHFQIEFFMIQFLTNSDALIDF